MRGARCHHPHGLRKTYDGTVAVESLDFAVDRGTILDFLGPNGAGKTGDPHAQHGPRAGHGDHVLRRQHVPHTDPVSRRRVGVVPGRHGYPATQTAQEWLSTTRRLFGSPGRAAAATGRLLGEVRARGPRRLPDQDDEPGHAAATGHRPGPRQRPRGRLPRRAHLGLDPAGQGQVLRAGDVGRPERGVTVVLSTHSSPRWSRSATMMYLLGQASGVRGHHRGDRHRGAADMQSALVESRPSSASRPRPSSATGSAPPARPLAGLKAAPRPDRGPAVSTARVVMAEYARQHNAGRGLALMFGFSILLSSRPTSQPPTRP